MRCMNRARHTAVAVALTVLLFAPAAVSVNAQEATTFTSAVVTNNFYDKTLEHNIPNLRVIRNGQTHQVNFLDHYNATGGLTRWGFPTSEVVEEETGNLSQYYQRGVVDWHWRQDLGRYVMERRLAWDFFGGGSGGSVDLGVEPGRFNPHPGEELGPWGHKVSDFSIEGIYTGFKSFFDSLGGVQAFGFPKTDARIDNRSPGTLFIEAADPGFIRQYFQSAVFEHHRGDQEPVKLRLLGDDLRNLNYPRFSWRTYAAFRPATALVAGQSYAVPRVTRRFTADGRPVTPESPTTPPATTPEPATTPAPGTTPAPTATPIPVPVPVTPARTSVWFGTATKGLAHYDGTDWETTRAFKDPLPSDEINDIFISADGSKWIATQEGLLWLKGASWVPFTTSASGFAGNEVTAVHAIGNLVWIGTDGEGASFGRISGSAIRWQTLDRSNSDIPSDVVRDVLIIGEQLNRVWLATNNGVAIYNNGTWQVFQNQLASVDTTSLAVDLSGNVWVGTNGNGVSVFNGVTWINHHRTNSDITNDTIRHITVGPDGKVWLATQSGVSVYDGVNWANYNRFTSGIASNDVYDIAIDSSGRAWAATDDGASVFASGVWNSYQSANSDLHDDSLRSVEVE